MATQPKHMSKSANQQELPIAGIIDWENLGELPEGWKLPTHLDLPDSDGRPVENFSENPQRAIITQSIRPILERRHPDKQYCIGQNSGIYWRWTEIPLDGAIVPDWFYVPDVPPMLQGEYRRSYVLWQEKKAPFLLLEFVSGSGEKERDDTRAEGKFWIYEQVVKGTYYGIFDSRTESLELYHLKRKKYKRVSENARGRVPITELAIELGIWDGMFMQHKMPFLRLWDSDGNMLLHSDERTELERERAEQEKLRAEQEKMRAEQEEMRAEQEKMRAEKLADKLRELGIDPAKI